MSCAIALVDSVQVSRLTDEYTATEWLKDSMNALKGIAPLFAVHTRILHTRTLNQLINANHKLYYKPNVWTLYLNLTLDRWDTVCIYCQFLVSRDVSGRLPDSIIIIYTGVAS